MYNIIYVLYNNYYIIIYKMKSMKSMKSMTPMNINKLNKKISLFIFIILILCILYLFYLLYTYLFSIRTLQKKDNFNPMIMIPTTTYNVSEGNTETINKQKAAESSTPVPPPEDSGKCGGNCDVMDYCINYKSCCDKPTDANKCVCSLPFVKNCRAEFEACLNNNPNKLSKPDLMTNCIKSNTSCCNKYNNIEIDSTKFSDPIKNEPSVVPICGIKNIKNLPQKCLELCTNTPNCKAYTVNIGKIAQDAGDCNLYDQLSITKPDIDVKTGKPKNNIATDYYTKN